MVERDRIITGMRRHDIGAANYFPCIHLQPFYRQRFGYEKGAFSIAESVGQRTIALPFSIGSIYAAIFNYSLWIHRDLKMVNEDDRRPLASRESICRLADV